MSWVMRTPRSTVGSYSNANWGVRFIRSSRESRACRTPWAASRPASERRRFFSPPSTLTKTRAWRRSGDVSTPVIVTRPIRGSFSSRIASASTSRTTWFTRRIRSVIGIHHLPLHGSELPVLAAEIALGLVEHPVDLTVLTRHHGQRQSRSLPDVVVVDLGDGRAHVLQARLGGAEMVALVLERVAGGEAQLAREDAHEARAHARIVAARRSSS